MGLMITDLFSAIDFNSRYSRFFNLYTFFLIVVIFNYFGFRNFAFKINKLLNLNDIIASKIRKNITIYLLILIMIININGNIPGTAPVTSILFLVLIIALFFFLIINISNFSFDLKKYLNHFVPVGAPTGLIPFLVLIETISNFIRPLTLTLRLVANIRAGHVVISIIRISLGFFSFRNSIVFVILVFYNLFELSVSAVQSYIFSLLVLMYINEHN